MSHLCDGFGGGRPQQIRHQFQLVHHVLSRKERSARQHFREYAPNAPDVDRWCVLFVTIQSRKRCECTEDQLQEVRKDLLCVSKRLPVQRTTTVIATVSR